MRITGLEKLQIKKAGEVRITPVEQDDLLILSNIIQPDDVVSADTTRKIWTSAVCIPGKKQVRGKTQVRVRFNIILKIKKVDYDVEDNSNVIRASGIVVSNQSGLTTGSFHTLELEKCKSFLLKKKSWDAVCIESFKESGKKKGGGCDLVVILVKSELAQIYNVGKNCIELCESIDNGLSKGKMMDKYFDKILICLTKNVNFDVLQCMVIAGPGSTKLEFKQHVMSQMNKVKGLQKVKSRMMTLDVNLVGKKGLMKVLSSPTAMNLIEGTKTATVLKAIKELTELFVFNPDKACYGVKSVEYASELCAIETLLIMDDLVRCADKQIRKKFEGLVKCVEEAGGKTMVLSPEHVPVDELAQLTETGVAAILRFQIDFDDS